MCRILIPSEPENGKRIPGEKSKPRNRIKRQEIKEVFGSGLLNTSFFSVLQEITLLFT